MAVIHGKAGVKGLMEFEPPSSDWELPFWA
jgi:hypothetical protein